MRVMSLARIVFATLAMTGNRDMVPRPIEGRKRSRGGPSRGFRYCGGG